MAESKRFLLRLNPALFEALRRWADDDMRSINAQIEYLLSDQARRAGRLADRKARPPRTGASSGAARPEDEAEGRLDGAEEADERESPPSIARSTVRR